jgi:hypothetical protein
MNRLFISVFIMSWSVISVAIEKPILVIGASYANANLPINDNLEGPLGGIAVDFGSYLSLGNALVRSPLLSGYVINEAQAGATSFDRRACNPTCSDDIGWQGYDKQFTKALARVNNPFIGEINADYLVITIGNDCLHSDAFGIPQEDSVPCSVTDMNAYVDRLIAVGQRAIDLGLTPIFDAYPEFDALDFGITQAAFGLQWMISESDYITLREIHLSKIKSALSGAVIVNMWKNFEHRGDGLHPTDETVAMAATKIARKIKRLERKKQR